MDKTESDRIRAYVDTLKPSMVGRLSYYLLPFRRRVVRKNIATVFDEILSPARQRRLAQGFYTHLWCSLRENLCMRFMSLRQIQRKATIQGVEHLQAVADQGHGVMVLTGHLGNWEFAPIAGILNYPEYQGRFLFIRKYLGNKWLERLLFDRFYRAGLGVIPKRHALLKVLDALEAQQVVVFVMDQHACVGGKDGLAVPFFGKAAGTYRSLATFARRHQSAVVPAQSYRKADGSHVLEFLPPVGWQSPTEEGENALLTNTKRYNQALERMILRFPDQWLWCHRRWKL